MRPPLSKELWFGDDPEVCKKLRFKQWNGKERRWFSFKNVEAKWFNIFNHILLCSIFFEHDDFYCKPEELDERENGGVAVVRGHRVSKIDPQSKKATLDSLQEITYDKCLIATGRVWRFLPILFFVSSVYLWWWYHYLYHQVVPRKISQFLRRLMTKFDKK